MSVITGKVKWAFVLKDSPNTHFEPKWCVDVVCTDETRKLVESVGLKAREDKDGDVVVTFSRKCETSMGKPRPAPVVIGKNGLPFTKPIGNGSVCKVQFRVDEWEYKTKKGIRGDLQGVMVEEYVPFSGGDGTELLGYVDPEASITDDNDIPF